MQVAIGLWLVTGCMPSRETRTAGQIGCSPEEISISGEQMHFGLLQTAETWTAECHGRAFVCTQMNETGEDQGVAGLLASKQVACAEEPENPMAEQRREAQQAQAVARSMQAPALPPSGAAGFELGQSTADLEQRCVGAGQRWEPGDETASCSGPAQDLGIDVQLSFRFCAGRACEITIEHRPSANWPARISSIKAQLEAKYGRPRDNAGPLPLTCRRAGEFERCLSGGCLELRYAWHWPAGENIDFVVGRPRADAPASIRIVYRRPAGVTDRSSL